MQILGNKGQASNAIVSSMIVLLIVAVVGIVGVTVYDSIAGSLGSDLTGTALATKNNFTENVYDGYDLAANHELNGPTHTDSHSSWSTIDCDNRVCDVRPRLEAF